MSSCNAVAGKVLSGPSRGYFCLTPRGSTNQKKRLYEEVSSKIDVFTREKSAISKIIRAPWREEIVRPEVDKLPFKCQGKLMKKLFTFFALPVKCS